MLERRYPAVVSCPGLYHACASVTLLGEKGAASLIPPSCHCFSGFWCGVLAVLGLLWEWSVLYSYIGAFLVWGQTVIAFKMAQLLSTIMHIALLEFLLKYYCFTGFVDSALHTLFWLDPVVLCKCYTHCMHCMLNWCWNCMLWCFPNTSFL